MEAECGESTGQCSPQGLGAMKFTITSGPGGVREGPDANTGKEWILYFEGHLVGAVTFRSSSSQPTKMAKTERERRDASKVPPACPQTSSSSSPFAKFNKKRAWGLWMKAREPHFFSVKGQTVNVSGFSSYRVSLATPWICSFRAESSH